MQLEHIRQSQSRDAATLLAISEQKIGLDLHRLECSVRSFELPEIGERASVDHRARRSGGRCVPSGREAMSHTRPDADQAVDG